MANLSTVSRTELEAMGKKEFLLSLQTMSPEAVKRFKSMRKLPDDLAHELEGYLVKIQQVQTKGPTASKASKKVQKKAPAKVSKPKPAKKQVAAADDNYVPFPDRFKAWWNGTDLPKGKDGSIQQQAKTSRPGAHEPAPSDTLPEEPVDWPDKIRERVWGEDFALPGRGSVIMSMSKAADLQPNDVVADILPGCTGPAKALAAARGMPVTVLLQQEQLDKLTLQKQKMERELAGKDTDDTGPQIDMALLDLGAPDFGIRTFDKLLCREVMCFIPERAEFLSKAAAGLRGGGRFVFYDVMEMGDGPEPDEVVAWREAEPFPPNLWTVSEYTKHLFDARLETKSTSNMSKSYISLVEADWRRVMDGLATDPLPRDGVDALMAEGRIWQSRLAALRTGRIGLVRFITTLRTIRSLSGPA